MSFSEFDLKRRALRRYPNESALEALAFFQSDIAHAGLGALKRSFQKSMSHRVSNEKWFDAERRCIMYKMTRIVYLPNRCRDEVFCIQEAMPNPEYQTSRRLVARRLAKARFMLQKHIQEQLSA